MPVPLSGGRSAAAVARALAAIFVLSIVEGGCGLFGYLLQKSPSNFGPCFVIFTIPLGIAAGALFAYISEKGRMTNVQFALYLALTAIAGAVLTLAYIAVQQ